MSTILHISKYYHPYQGGIETVAKYLAEGLSQYRNVVVCFSSDNHYHEDDVDGIKVYRVPVNFSMMSQDVSVRYLSIMRRLIKEYQPEALHVHCPNPFVYPIVMMCAPKHTKVVLHWHSDILSKGLMYTLIKPLEDRILRRADAIVSTSPNYIPDSKPLLKYRDKVWVVQNGIIEDNFRLQPGDADKVAALRRQYGDRKIVFFVGRHVAYKGIDKLLEADALIKEDCVILIAGKGPLDPTLHAMPHSDRVQFVGRLSDDDIRIYLHAAHIFAFPSNTKAEAFGVALAEAMYCRCVPVSFRIEGSGVNWVSVADDTGLVVPLNDVQAFAQAVDRLLTDDALRERFAERAHQRVTDKFTSRKAVEVMQLLYKSLLPSDQ